jgi:hypothetical protein
MKRFAVLGCWILAASSWSVAQIGDWQAVERLAGGTKIKVALVRGHTFGHCTLAGVDDDQLSCEYPGPFGTERRAVYLRGNIRAIYRVHNSAMIGLGVGAVTGAALGAATYSKSNDPNFGRVGTPIVSAAILGGLGMGIGGILNPFFHGKAVYRSASPPAKQAAPKHAQKDEKSPTVANEENANQAPDKIPCLRDVVTLQCVQ